MDFWRKAFNIAISIALLTYIGASVIRLTLFFLEKN